MRKLSDSLLKFLTFRYFLSFLRKDLYTFDSFYYPDIIDFVFTMDVQLFANEELEVSYFCDL